jgi:hypothetical protein
MPNRGKHLLDNAIMFSAFSGATRGAGTIDSSGVGVHIARARIYQILMTLAPPAGGAPTIQAIWQSTPISPFAYITIPNATGPAITVPAGGQLAIAKLDADFIPRSHAFIRLRTVVVGAGTFNFQGVWICEDLDSLPPPTYEQFPVFRPLELAIVDSTLLGTNQA